MHVRVLQEEPKYAFKQSLGYVSALYGALRVWLSGSTLADIGNFVAGRSQGCFQGVAGSQGSGQ